MKKKSIFVLSLALALHAAASEGFFSVRQKENGVWTFVDTEGRDFFLRAVDHIGDIGNKNGGHDIEAIKGQMKAWGFNVQGVRGSSRSPMVPGMPWYCNLKLGATLGDTPAPERGLTLNRHVPGTAMPNVFRKDFETEAFNLARKLCAPFKDDRLLVGYCIDNELAFQGTGRGAAGRWGLFEAARTKPATNSAHVALMDFLASKGLPSADAVPMSVREEFCRLVARRYFDVLTRAIRAADPNHLILGCRFARHYDWTDEEAGKYVDVVTFNCYPNVDLDKEAVDPNAVKLFHDVYARARKPIVVTEWSFPAVDVGYAETGPGAGQRFMTQSQRAKATEIFARTMLAMPFVAGYSYFMWQDSPAGSREETNYGLLDRHGNPFPEITQMFASLHSPGTVARARPDGTTFVRDGEKWHLETTDGLLLSGKIGKAPLCRLRYRGGDFGVAMAAMMLDTGAEAPRIREGFVSAWPDVTEIRSVEFKDAGDYRKAGRIVGAGSSGEQRFEMEIMAIPMERPGTIRFEIVSIRNVGAVPLRGVRAMLRHYPPFKNVVNSGAGRTVYGKQSAAELHSRATGASLRCMSEAKTLFKMDFHVDKAGVLHPDVYFVPWFEKGRSGFDALWLAPGETYRPASPMYDEVVLSKGQTGT